MSFAWPRGFESYRDDRCECAKRVVVVAMNVSFFFLFLDRVCIFIRCDESAATVLELGRYSIKLGRVRVDFVDLSRFFRMTSNVNIYGGGFRFFFFFKGFLFFMCER